MARHPVVDPLKFLIAAFDLTVEFGIEQAFQNPAESRAGSKAQGDQILPLDDRLGLSQDIVIVRN